MDSASAKNVATCEEFSVEDTYPAPPRTPNGATSSNSIASGASSQALEAGAKLPSVPEGSGAGAKAEAAAQLDTAKSGAATGLAVPPAVPRGPSLDRTSVSYKGDARSGASAFGALDRVSGSYPGTSLGRVSGRELGTPQNSLKLSESGKGMMAARTLMFFKGCPKALGCTVLLKGAPREALAAVKKVMQVCSLPPSDLLSTGHPGNSGCVSGLDLQRCPVLFHCVGIARTCAMLQ